MKVRWYLLPFLLPACGCRESQSPDSLYQESERLFRRGQNRQALKTVDRGWRNWKSNPTSPWHWKFRLLEAELLISEGSIESARELLAGAPPSGDLRARHLSLLALATRDRTLADRAFELASVQQDAALMVATELRRANLDGYSTRSEAFLSNAVRIGKAQSDKYWEARAFGDAGYRLLSLSRFDEAVPLLEHAEALAKQAGADRTRERILGNLGWCYSRLGDSDRALAALSEAAAGARQVEDEAYLHRWLNDLGVVRYQRREYAQAIWNMQASPVT